MGPLSPIRSHPTQCNPVHSNPIQSTTTHSNPTQCNTKQPNPIQQMHLAQDLSCEIVFQVLSKRLPPTVLNTLHPGWCQRRRRQRKFPRSPPSGCLKFNQISKPYYVMPTYSWLCAFMCSPPVIWFSSTPLCSNRLSKHLQVSPACSGFWIALFYFSVSLCRSRRHNPSASIS